MSFAPNNYYSFPFITQMHSCVNSLSGMYLPNVLPIPNMSGYLKLFDFYTSNAVVMKMTAVTHADYNIMMRSKVSPFLNVDLMNFDFEVIILFWMITFSPPILFVMARSQKLRFNGMSKEQWRIVFVLIVTHTSRFFLSILVDPFFPPEVSSVTARLPK